jgi:N-acetylglucosamine kinase-like BadF-type ATPase
LILIADSGGTKCDWIRLSEGAQFEFSTEGINPLFTNATQINDILTNSLAIQHKEDVEKVFFYGAGCSNEINNKLIKDACQAFFTKATVEVNHDLLGAARACCGDNKAFCAILGTGSNLCYYDGESVHRETRSLGYILGDEGSGANIGKEILKAFLYNSLPADLVVKFKQYHKEDEASTINSLYTSNKPNQYLASFARFAAENKNHPFIHRLVKESFSAFFSIHLWKYQGFRSSTVNFVGSIAFYFQDILQEVAINHRFTAGKIVQKPIKELALYHQNNL